MRSSATRLLSGLSTPFGRSTGLPLATNSNHILSCVRYFHRSTQNYCPIFSTLNNSKSPNVKRDEQFTRHGVQTGPNVTSLRSLANTTSGYFAPSTIHVNSHRVKSREPRGILSVYKNNDHLPALPVPNLDETLDRLIETISPIAMNSAEFAHALHLIEKFSQSAGKKLNLLLRNKAEQTKNWMTHDWWLREAYLKSRSPLVINSNPAMIYPVLPFEVTNQRAFINTVAQLISGVIDYKLALENGYNPEATSLDNEYHLDPYLCYDQYKNVFGSIRVPGEDCDSFLGPMKKSNPKSTSSNEENIDPNQQESQERDAFNLVISFRGSFFEIQLREFEDESSRIDTLTKILSHLVDSVESSNNSGIGVLTTQNRDEWSKAYKLLDENSLEAMRSAQFLVCIDTIGEQPEDAYLQPLLNSPIGSEQHLTSLARQILHSDRQNVGNRWFDKTLSLIVVTDENAERLLGAGINNEHTVSEAVVFSKLIEYSYDKLVQKHRNQKEEQQQQQQVALDSNCPAVYRQLKMVDELNSPIVCEHIKQAQLDFVSHLEQFSLSCLNYKQYGASKIKSWHFSPDSWVQISLLLASYNLHKRHGPCYETASTRQFAYGRTETIRSLNKDVAEFCSNPKYETMKGAIESHKSYANAAKNAAAIDRVLMGYKLIFNELKANNWTWGGLPDNQDENNSKHQMGISQVDALFTELELDTLTSFFNDPLIERSKKWYLSTSQVSSIHPNIFMCFGPSLADGYGCCYNITDQQIVVSISANSLNQSFSCDVDDLNASLRDSLDIMRELVEERRN